MLVFILSNVGIFPKVLTVIIHVLAGTVLSRVQKVLKMKCMHVHGQNCKETLFEFDYFNRRAVLHLGCVSCPVEKPYFI